MFYVERDLVRVSCPDCGRSPVRAATSKHAALAEKCGVVKVTVTSSKKKG